MNKNILNEINRYREIVGLSIINEQESGAGYKFSNGGGGSVDGKPLHVEVDNNGNITWLGAPRSFSPSGRYDMGNQYNIYYDLFNGEVVGDERGGNNVSATEHYYKDNYIFNELYPLQRADVVFWCLSVTEDNKPYLSGYFIGGPTDEKTAYVETGKGNRVERPIIAPNQYWCRKGRRKGKECYYLDSIAGPPPSSGDGRVQTIQQKVIEVPFSFTEPFIFDTVDFTPETQSNFDKQINLLKTYLENIEGYKEFLSRKRIIVRAYASRDNDPSAKVQGKYRPCKGFGDGTRGQYNQCLSQARAEKIVELLSAEFPDLKFNPQGMGETDSFGPGWTESDSPTTTQTQPNRRFDVIIPKFTRVDRG